MWSLGVIIYIMLCGYPPFYPSQPTRKGIDKTMKKRIANAEFEFPQEEWSLVSDNAKDLISGLLTVDPVKRLTIADVLAHPWLVSQESDLNMFFFGKETLKNSQLIGNFPFKI